MLIRIVMLYNDKTIQRIRNIKNKQMINYFMINIKKSCAL